MATRKHGVSWTMRGMKRYDFKLWSIEIMKSVRLMLFVLLCGLPLWAMTANGAEVAKAKPAKAAEEKSVAIPIQILGKTFELRQGMSRSDAKAALSSIIKEESSLDTDEMLQYDVILVPDQGPVAINVNFDKKGVVNGLTLDSTLKEQNPAVTTLLGWLKTNVGKPKAQKKGSATWNFGGWKIEHAEGGSGEDSTYRIEFTRLK